MPLERVELRPPRLRPPGALGDLFTDDRYERVSRTLGKAFRDLARGFRGEFPSPPDLVARPRDESEVEVVLAWCEEQGAAVIPFGGGTSVVGGVEARLGDPQAPAVTLDVRRLDRVLDVDPVSLAARIQAGATGPRLEEQLREHGLTLRHFPQSFEFSTLGGWLATRAGGHFATAETHIDDLVESVRAITPRGTWESRRLPGSGAGPSPDRMLLGSEGILGVITEAWVRVRPRPRRRASRTVRFADLPSGAAAVRGIVQSGLRPANCRLLDPEEARLFAGGGGEALLVLSFESAGRDVGPEISQALAIAEEGTGRPDPAPPGGDGKEDAGGAAGSWREAFLRMPYLRDSLLACGVLSETFETAITWDRFEDFHGEVVGRARRAAAEASGAPAEGPGSPHVSCRFTHVYADGPAAYYTVIAPAVEGGEAAQWDEIKAAVSEAVVSAGGTITHHHAVGRDHRPFYDRQRPGPFAAALRGAKAAVDPAGMMNPGVLVG
ncbi:MAG: FAD-binding oxidoreductase [Solirubrobacterales bacterium]